MARVAAAKALEDVAEAAERVPLGGAARTPGVVIIIGGEPIAGPPAGGITIDHAPRALHEIDS